MAFWRQLSRGVRSLTDGSASDRDARDEVRHFLEQSAAEHAARGLSPEEALRAARLELGGSETGVREQVRSYGWENVVRSFFADLRYATRRLRAQPGFTSVTVLTVAIGVGATTAIFSAVNPILFESLPYPDSGRVAMIWELRRDDQRADGTFGMYREIDERARSFGAVAVFKPWMPAMTGLDQPERLNGQRVSASYFDVLRVSPVLGRNFRAEDDRPNTPTVVILSHALWLRRFAGDPAIVGQQITVDDLTHTVIGVMPQGFENVLSPAADVWAPLLYDMSQGRAWGHHLRTVARLQPGVGVAQAAEELNALGRAVIDELHPVTYGREVRFLVSPLQHDLTHGVRRTLLAVFGAVFLVLAIACVNVISLLLARDVSRRSEYALRAALGAGRGRLVRQIVTESLLLSAIGGVVGMAVASFGVRALVALSPPDLPRVEAIHVDGGVFAFGLGIATLIGLAIGLLLGLQVAHGDPQAALQQGSKRTSGGHRRALSALVVAEVALALVLLVSSGLLFRSLTRLFAIDSGFQASHLLTMQVQTSGRRFDDAATRRFFEAALEAARQVPGVTAAALTSQLPVSGDSDIFGVRFEPKVPEDPGELSGTYRYAVSPGYFETMGIPLVRGRLLEKADRADAPRVAVVSESFAKRRLPGLDPIGRRVTIGDSTRYTIVGVVGNVKQMSLALTDSEALYTTLAQWRFAELAMSLVVKTRADAGTILPPLRQAIWSVDKDQPIVRVATMERLLAATAAQRRFALILFEAFALAALILAAAGIYGVLAGSVAERTREIGVRAALGASRSNICAMVLREGLKLTGIGAAIGLAGAVAASQVIAAMLFGISPLDAITYGAVVALLAVVSAIACAVPAWRAVRVDPVIALRAE